MATMIGIAFTIYCVISFLIGAVWVAIERRYSLPTARTAENVFTVLCAPYLIPLIVIELVPWLGPPLVALLRWPLKPIAVLLSALFREDINF